MAEVILVEKNAGIVQIVFNRIEKKNALNLAMYERMAERIKQAAAESDTRVLLFAGAGGCFTAGNDLNDFARMVSTSSEINSEDNAITRFLTAVAEFPKPVVAAVDGLAVGIGTTLLLHCDLVYCHSASRFSLPFVNLALRPEFSSSYLLPRAVGHVRAAEWLLLGEPFSAEAAAAAGLVNKVVEQPLAFAKSQCEKICRQPPLAVLETKALLKNAERERVQAAADQELRCFAKALTSPEFAEAAAAFFEKRPPNFENF